MDMTFNPYGQIHFSSRQDLKRIQAVVMSLLQVYQNNYYSEIEVSIVKIAKKFEIPTKTALTNHQISQPSFKLEQHTVSHFNGFVQSFLLRYCMLF